MRYVRCKGGRRKKMSRQTQYDDILRYLNEFGSITPMEAFTELGITKLATRVSEMRTRRGIEFEKRIVKGKNRYGNTVHYMRYSLRD